MANWTATRIEAVIERIIQSRMAPDAFGSRTISVDTPLLGNELGLDSLEALEIAMEIEGEFGIFIDDDAMTVDLFENMGTLASYVRRQLK